ILEAPHKDEYFHNIPIRPANGRTGDRIEAKIGDRAYNRWNLPKNFDYVVHIMNAVQYQCSCYKVLHDFYSSESHTNRNQVFKLLFGNNGFKLNRDFIDRLENLSPYYVINCVTKQLKKTVGDEMKNNYSLYNKNKYEEDDHPSCWK
ncbi:MAG: hypothetical protein MJ213_05640, partial [Bacilli bacterium]|nr:hypothetical protein [Bacilli bacterium]